MAGTGAKLKVRSWRTPAVASRSVLRSEPDLRPNPTSRRIETLAPRTANVANGSRTLVQFAIETSVECAAAACGNFT
jgi:hypothetical protein